MESTSVTSYCSFNLKNIKTPSNILVIGPAGSGKTQLCESLVSEFGNPENTIRCSSERLSNCISEFLKDQKNKLIENRIDMNRLFVIEDCTDKKMSENIANLLYKSRHYFTTCILSTPSIQFVNFTIFSSVNYVFLCRGINLEDQMKIYSRFRNLFPNFISFSGLLGKMTEDYGLMAIDCSNGNIFYY